MSDFLKTPVTNIASTKWTAGEQPSASKFRLLFNSYYNALNSVCKILGPLQNDNRAIATPGNIVSSYNHGRMSSEEKNNLILNAEDSILNTFNLARIIGPHASLNPVYLPGSVHLVASQGNGWLLEENKIQQLPFPPHTESASAYEYDEETELYTCNYNVEIYTNGVFGTWLPVGTPEECLFSVDKVFHLAKDGTLYSSCPFIATEYIKYDLYVPNTFGVLGSGYNAIPDLSIFSLTDVARQNLYNTDDEYGAIILSYVTSSGSQSKWKVKLPKVISSKDSLTSLNDRGISATLGAGSFEPFGEFITDGITSGKYYVLNSDIYIAEDLDQPNTITQNVLALYDTRLGETYSVGLSWDITSDKRELYLYGPLSLKNKFVASDGETLLSSNPALTNSKDFVLFCLGTNLSETVSQNTLNYARHKHNGSDSYRVSHRDLLYSENNLQGIGPQDGTDGGLNFIDYNRQLAYSDCKDNPHAQYMNRLGFLYGGSQGLYQSLVHTTKTIDLNMMHGDLLFYPIESAESGNKPYKYADLAAWITVHGAGDNEEKIYWENFSLEPTLAFDVLPFANYRTHAMIFGMPNTPEQALEESRASLLGATKLYYEPWNFLADTEYDNTGNKWTLSRHGFIPGNETGLYGNANRRGLNINWGNLFFGYREDIFGGLLLGDPTGGGPSTSEASAFFRTSEFNIVSTGNGKAGSNTNSSIKNNYTYRDGVAIRAVRGSNIWLSAGGIAAANASTGNVNGKPSIIAIEASNPAWYDEAGFGQGGLKTALAFTDTRSQGSGIFLAPSVSVDPTSTLKYIPWAKPGEVDRRINAMWDGTEINQAYNNQVNGSVLDIFALARDYNKGTNSYFPQIGQDSSLKGWVYGRPYIRGTYGINFCASVSLDDLDSDYDFGFRNKQNGESWGPTTVSLSGGSKEYVHREFRFWGNHDLDFSGSENFEGNTAGGNINLLYNFGRSYKRHGRNFPWSNGNLHGIPTGSYSGTINSVWANSKAVALGGSRPESYGSSIRQASFIEAFQGFRSDPMQPYMAEYVMPFRVQIPLESGVNFASSIHNRNIVITDTDITIEGESAADFYSDNGHVYGKFSQNYSLTNTKSLGLDAIIRGAEEIFLENSGPNGLTILPSDLSRSIKTFPKSLVSYSVDLQYYCGVVAPGTLTNSKLTPAGDPHNPDTNWNYSKIQTGNVIMISAEEAAIQTTVAIAGNNNKLGVVRSGNESHFTYRVAAANNYQLLPYGTFLATIKVEKEYINNSGFPLFLAQYPEVASNNAFALVINMLNNNADADDANPFVPYRVYRTDYPGSTDEILWSSAAGGAGIAVEFNGIIKFKFIRAASGL